MAAKVFLISADNRNTDKVKRCTADSLVRQLLAVKESAFVYRRLRIRPTEVIASGPQPPTEIPWGLEPLIDAMLGVIDQSPVLAEQIRFRHI